MAKNPPESARRRGRPCVDATQIMTRLRPDELAKLDRAIKGHGGDLSRPEALRALAQSATVKALKDAIL